MLDAHDQESLLAHARGAIARALDVPFSAPAASPSAVLQAPLGAFVTLHGRTGALRGCIGTLDSDRPLLEVVERMAVSAALEDPRFPALSAEELDEVVIEISVLSPLRPVQRLDEVEVGRDGLLVSGFGRRGVLLPQVATEHGLDRDGFLAATCRKAGLPEDAWQSGLARLERFQAQVFSEPGSPHEPGSRRAE